MTSQLNLGFIARALLAAGLVKLLLLATRASTGGLSGGLDTVASFVLAAGGTYYLLRGLAALRRRLLWRVRRKLIISYLFVGVIPATLIIAFFLLGGYLLFVNVTSYMLQTHLREVGNRARSVAEAIAIETSTMGATERRRVLERRLATLGRETPAASVALVPVSRRCDVPSSGEHVSRPSRAPVLTAGPWSHASAPAALPAWIGCDGYVGLFVVAGSSSAVPGPERPGRTSDAPVELIVRAVVWPPRVPGHAVVVDVPLDAEARARLRADTSLILTGAQLTGADPQIQLGRARTAEAISPAGDTRPAPPATGSAFQASVSFLDYRDWSTGEPRTAQAAMTVDIPEVYTRLTRGQGPNGDLNLSQAFVFVLIGVGALFLFIQVVAIATGLALAKSITGSVHELFAGTVKVQQGDFSHRIAIRAPDQLGALAESFNSMTSSIEGLLIEAAEKKRLEEELRIAHEIQMSLLPTAPASIPGLSIAALCLPAREVGGDYYDFLPLPDGQLGLLIADVAGKGTSAALYMAELKGLMVSLSRTYQSPRDLLIVANQLIAEHLDARSFITMIYAIIDLRARTMTYARAGHTPLLYLPGPAEERQRGVQVLTPDGLVLGLKIDDGTLFTRLLTEQTLALHTGDVIVFFTDGMSEAMNAQDDCFGEHRLSRSIELHADLSVEGLRDALQRDVQDFAGGTPQHDDMTMILVKVGDLEGQASMAGEQSEAASA